MFFAKYLIDNKYINKEQFLECVKIHQEIVPSFFSSLVELNLLHEDELYELCQQVIKNKSTFVSEVSEDVRNMVYDYQKNNQKSIAELLYENGHISAENLKEASKNYRSDLPSSEESPVVQDATEEESVISAAALESLKELQGDSFDMSEFSTTERTTSEDDSNNKEVEVVVETEDNNESSSENSEVELSAAAIESLKELQGDSFDMSVLGEASNEKKEEKVQEQRDNLSEKEIVQDIANHKTEDECDFAQIFNLKKYNKILKIKDMILKAAQNDGEVSNYLNSLYKEVHIVKGAAALDGVSKLSRMLDVWELIIDLLFKKDETFLRPWANKYITSLEETLDVSWKIREGLNSGLSEDDIFKQDDVKCQYITCISNLKNSLKYIKEG
ncbi:MAG: hypothetical protein VX341_11660 [Bdellovibrionota bacterium]|nr:hypothetical protein [Bdellovibrionota bacterium]